MPPRQPLQTGGSPVYCGYMVPFLLVTQVSVQRDTIVTVAARDSYDVVMVIAAIAVTITAITALVTGLLALYAAREAVRATDRLKEQLATDPTIASLRRAVANAEVISERVKAKASAVSDSLSNLSERIDQASDRIEERIDDLNALVEVVQGEVEGGFVKGASVARGVRAGLGKLMGRKPRGAAPRDPMDDPL